MSAENIPRYYWILGCIEMAERRPLKALRRLRRAESILREQRALLMLPLVLHASADAYRRIGDLDKAGYYCSEAIEVATSRGLVSIQTESLILRAGIDLKRALKTTDSPSFERDYEILQAMDDADAALSLAKEHHYPWLKLNALLQLAKGAKAQGNTDAAKEYRRKAESLSKHLMGDSSEDVA